MFLYSTLCATSDITMSQQVPVLNWCEVDEARDQGGEEDLTRRYLFCESFTFFSNYLHYLTARAELDKCRCAC